MARLTFKRLLLVGVAVAAGAAYAKRDTVRQLLPGGSSPEPQPYSPPSPQPSNYDAPGPPANTATPVPAPEPVVTPEPGRSDPVEEQAIDGDDPVAVEDAIADAAAEAEASGGPTIEETAAPEPIDEAAEEQAAAAEAAAIGGSAGNAYAGNELGEPATEAERPLAEAGQGVAEGQEQAEAELAENAGPGDEGTSDAERQIDETIEAAGNPAVGETPGPVTPPQDAADSDDDDISGGDWKTWSGGAVKPQ